MIAVTDTSPLCYLILIGEIELLPKIFSEVLAPQAVIAELHHEDAPAAVRAWVSPFAARTGPFRAANVEGAVALENVTELPSRRAQLPRTARYPPVGVLEVPSVITSG
jgi:hypothetical protein